MPYLFSRGIYGSESGTCAAGNDGLSAARHPHRLAHRHRPLLDDLQEGRVSGLPRNSDGRPGSEHCSAVCSRLLAVEGCAIEPECIPDAQLSSAGLSTALSILRRGAESRSIKSEPSL